jgi:tetratricopeptide (TPR) repeat protein
METAQEYFLKGIDLQQRGLFDNAIEEYERALNLEPENNDILVNLGAACLQKGLSDRAIRLLSKALKADPDNSLALYNIGKAFVYQDDFESALLAFERALELLPEDLEVKKSIFHCYQKLDNIESAAELGESIIEKMIDDSGFLLMLGDIFMRLEKFENALQIYRKASAVACDSIEPLMGIYYSQLALNNREKAATTLKRAMMMEPENQQLQVMMVDLLLEDGCIQEAVDLLKKGISSLEDPSMLQDKFNELARRLPILRKKVDAAGLRVKQSAYETDVYDILDNLYDGKTSLDIALKELNSLRQRDPDDLFIAKELANLLFQSRDFEKAAEVYSEIRASVPSDPNSRVELAKSLAMNGDSEAARAVLKEAVRDLGHCPELSMALVELDLFDKEFARAAGRLDMVLKEYPYEPHALFLYGYTALRLNELNLAEKYMQELLEKTPEDEELVVWYSRLCILQGMPQRALEAWNRFHDGIESLVEIITRAELTLASGDSRGIMKWLKRIGEYYPRFMEDHLLFGKAFFFAGDFASAQREFDLVLKHEARNAEALAMSAMNMLIRNKVSRFWNYWHQAVDNDSLYAVIPGIILKNSLNFTQKERLKAETRKIIEIASLKEEDRARLVILLKNL